MPVISEIVFDIDEIISGREFYFPGRDLPLFPVGKRSPRCKRLESKQRKT